MLHHETESFFPNPTQKQIPLISSRRGWEGKDRMSCQLPSPPLLRPSFQKVGRGLCSFPPPPVTYMKMSLGRNTSATWGFFSPGFLQLTPSVSPSPETNRCSAAFLQGQEPDVSPPPPTLLSHLAGTYWVHFILTALTALITYSHSSRRRLCFMQAVSSRSCVQCRKNLLRTLGE